MCSEGQDFSLGLGVGKEASHVVSKPRSTADGSFPASAGMDTLRLEFVYPDGRSVYVASVRIKG